MHGSSSISEERGWAWSPSLLDPRRAPGWPELTLSDFSNERICPEVNHHSDLPSKEIKSTCKFPFSTRCPLPEVSATMLGCFGYSCGFFQWVALANVLHLHLAVRLLSGLPPLCPQLQPKPVLCLLWFFHPLSLNLFEYSPWANCIKSCAVKLQFPSAWLRLSPLAHRTSEKSHWRPCLSSPSAAWDRSRCLLYKCNHLRDVSQL